VAAAGGLVGRSRDDLSPARRDDNKSRRMDGDVASRAARTERVRQRTAVGMTTRRRNE